MGSFFLLGVLGIYAVGIGLGVAHHRRGLNRVDLNEPDGVQRVVDELQIRSEEMSRDGRGVDRMTACIAHGPDGPVVRTSYGLAPLYERVGWRMRVSGLEAARVAAFRITKGGARRAQVDVSAKSSAARVLLDDDEVRACLRDLLGARLRFRAIDLFPGGDLAVDCLPLGELGGAAHRDMIARMIAFAEALERAGARLDRAQIGASSSASGAPVTFSIDVRR